MRIVVGLILILTCQLFAYSPVYAQAAEDPAPQSELDPLLLIREWFLRLNALDDWSPDNLENQVEEEFGEPESEEPEPEEPEVVPDPEDSAPLVERFVELFRPDAFFFVRPNQDQVAPVMYNRDDGVRKWADYQARTLFELGYYINDQTDKEITTKLIYSTPLPWGGLAASVEFRARYAFRDGEKRYTAPGAAFFQFAEDGKIKWLRLYELADETFEVFP